MVNRLVAARGQGDSGKEGSGCGYKGVSEMELCGNGTVLYLDYGGGYTNLHMIKLHRTTHIHK